MAKRSGYISLDEDAKDDAKKIDKFNLSNAMERRLSFNTASRFRKYAITLSLISVLFPLSTGIAAIVLSTLKTSQTLFGYGLDAILDSMSSIVVIWRFFGSSTVVYSPTKERMACIVVAALFFVAATCLVGKSAHALVVHLEEEKSMTVLMFAVISGIVSVILAVMKVYLGYELESRVLLTDSVITFTAAAISFASCIGMFALDNDPSMWVMDPVFGILCGGFLTVFGTKLMVDMTCCYRDPSQVKLEESNTDQSIR